ncbi:MAG TPA: biosynthetic-type acetolactate synthase large subunit [Syntrophales bacterium]|nr:biosynthetic-type acetolactate synthase large subunit [Syntrophales bacterium]HOU78193.1 biosynthetic-type acetolactate synthase large subunit [Syntrophales bacterium]HQG35163.1 biosynthetic-type acetolactate synthase large subunit [Syntrophales bacterium]HQI36756.1 biosynthetic-type acetolactate synthase large subunit [Syntrophales bacterium]HQJ31222.1 biosynthetic-type acetolactate synthase large subunit [Syntrophales bacterium]
MQLRGAEILIKVLKEEGIHTIFGYPGGVLLDIYDELHKGHIRHILVRHEQGAVHAADGFARASGKVGVALVTSGPGASNTVTGIANAYMDSIPIVVLTGQVPTHLIGTDAFQEVDIVGITRPCTKHNFLIKRVEEVAKTLREAFHIARSGRPGPVLVDLPKDVMAAVTDYEPQPARKEEEAKPRPASKKAFYVLDLITEATKPMILSGGGVILGGAAAELRKMAWRTRMPVSSTLMGLGAFPGSDPLWLGMPGMHGTYYANMAISHCDLLIAIGMRFDDRVTGKIDHFAPNAKIVHVDVDPSSINKNVMVDVPIVSDCKSALQSFNALLEQQNFTVTDEQRQEWFDQIAAWRKENPLGYCQSDTEIKPQFVIETLYKLTKGKAIITTEVGQNQMWAAQFYQYDEPNTFLSSGGLGTMGYGFPAALGAKIAFPDKLVVDIAGDGSIQMNIQEMATAIQDNIPVKIVLLNNGYLGMVRQWQQLFYGKRYSHTDMTYQPDFLKLAEAYGWLGLRATRPEEVETVLRQGLEAPGPALMDFRVSREECVYPMVRPGGPIHEMTLGREMAN